MFFFSSLLNENKRRNGLQLLMDYQINVIWTYCIFYNMFNQLIRNLIIAMETLNTEQLRNKPIMTIFIKISSNQMLAIENAFK